MLLVDIFLHPSLETDNVGDSENQAKQGDDLYPQVSILWLQAARAVSMSSLSGDLDDSGEGHREWKLEHEDPDSLDPT